MTIFDDIRAACKRVAALADQVHIVDDRLDAYAASLPVDELRRPFLEEEHHWVGRGDQTVAYVLTLDAVNFGSGYFAELRPRAGLDGYFLVARALRDRFAEQGPFSAGELTEMTPEQCARLFGQTLDEPGPRELMGHFARALRDLGVHVSERFDGDFSALVEGADHSASALVEELSEMPLYHDVPVYRGFDVPLYKRAQITVADLHMALEGRGLGRFDDLDQITMFADNQVPHVLHLDGVLEYSEPLADAIAQRRPIPAGSPEEVELRACALHTVERLVEKLAEKGYAVSALEVDNYLWHRGEQPRYQAEPMHLTKTVYY